MNKERELELVLEQCEEVVSRKMPLLVLAPEYTKILQEYIDDLKKQNEVLLESLCLAKQKYKNDKAKYRRKAKTYRERLNKAITYIIDYNDRVMNTENELPGELYEILRGNNETK